MTAVGMDLGYSMPKLRLTPRGRAVFTTLAAIPLVIAAAFFALNGGGAVATQDVAQPGVVYEYVTVEAGESLWAVATEIAPSADPRDVVSDILAFNGMSSAELQPGQRLAVPTQYAK
jgi:hypothetical protein